jgi:hypothetical protein
MFRVSYNGEGLDDANTIEGGAQIVREQAPGRYGIGEIRVDPGPSGHCRRWGVLFKLEDGTILAEPGPSEV